MIKSKDNYPKAIAVYEAVLQLIQEERELPTVTVSEIAKKAGIGKGTTYDYFESKEEIIAKSLIYGYKKMIEYILEQLAEAVTLKEKIICMYCVVEKFGCANSVIESALKMVRKPEEMKEHICDAFTKDKIHVKYNNRIVEDLMKAAQNEGIIGVSASSEYVKCTIYTITRSIFNHSGDFFIQEKIMTKETYLDYIYQMLIAALSTAN